MLSQENNELLTRVGPGTPMGQFMRRFWMPALLEEEIAGPDCNPVRLRLLGEDLVAFRDTNGRVGILQERCAHRAVSLFFGRNEECGLRCVYHGWKYDVDGNCIDMPSEPDGGAVLKQSVKIVSYPTRLRAGVVWVYMGPKDFAAEPPDVEWATLPARQRTAIKRFGQCNWVQAVEGGLNSSHISFLHSRTDKQQRGDSRRDVAISIWGADKHPVFEVKETRYGLLVGARRTLPDNRYYWRITQFLQPFYTMVPPRNETDNSAGTFYWGHAWVPIDDKHTWNWSFSANPWREYSDQELAWNGGRDGFWGPVDEHYKPIRNKENDYLLDRERQRKVDFSGIDGFGDQDAAALESMGPILDRNREEYLGHSDRAIVAFRRQLLALVKESMDGKEPEAAKHGDWYKVRSASVVLKGGQPFDKGAAWLLSAQARAATEIPGIRTVAAVLRRRRSRGTGCGDLKAAQREEIDGRQVRHGVLRAHSGFGPAVRIGRRSGPGRHA